MAEYETVQIPVAINGLNKDLQPTQIPSASPNMINMYVEPWGVRKRLGYIKKGLNLPLTGIGMELIQYTDARGDIHQVALTSTCAFLYDSSYDQWLEKMPSVQMQDCEAHGEWTGGSDITTSDSTDNVEGTNSLKLLAGDDIAAGSLIASTTTFDDSADISDYGSKAHISFWYLASKADVCITIHVKDADTDIEATSYINSPNADTWYHCCVEVDLSGINTATSIEIDTETALENGDYILVDDIRATNAFSGTYSNRWSHSEAFDTSVFTNNGGSALVISNNIDNPLYYEGQAGDRFQELDLSDIDSFAYCKEVIEFWNHFFLLNFNNGNNNVRSLLYSDLGNIEEYTLGTSGANTLTDTKGQLLRAKKLGSDMVLYSESSITICRYLGSTVPFVFPTIIYETGLFSEKSIWDFVNVHYFLGTDQKIYSYTGGNSLQLIGDSIEDSLFDEVDVSKKGKTVFAIDYTKKKLHIFFARSSDDYAKVSYTYNYKYNTWEYHQFNDYVRDFSLFVNKASWYCNGDEIGANYCDELSIYCDDSTTESGYPTPIFISDDGYIYLVNDATSKDDDRDITGIYETFDYTIDLENSNFRVSELSLNAMSSMVNSEVRIFYSIDGGDYWYGQLRDKIIVSIADGLANKWQESRVPLDVVCRKIRFMFFSVTKDFQLRSIHIKRCVESER